MDYSSTDMTRKYNQYQSEMYSSDMDYVDTVDTNRSYALDEEHSSSMTSRTRTFQPHMTLYNSVIEEKIIIEQVDTSNQRLAMESRTFPGKYKVPVLPARNTCITLEKYGSSSLHLTLATTMDFQDNGFHYEVGQDLVCQNFKLISKMRTLFIKDF